MTRLNRIGAALAVALVAAPTMADTYETDLAVCEARAAARMESNRSPSTQGAMITAAANVLGAILGGYNPSAAISGAAQSTVHGAANDARQAEWRRQALIDECLRERARR